jgi:uncharacterized protein YbjT (DUF2867 family)
MKHQKILIVGGTGFIGKRLAIALANHDCDVLLPCRRPHRHRDLLVNPRIRLIEANVFDTETLNKLCINQHAVINLVGILHENKVGDFRRVHIEFIKSLVAACTANKVKRLLHISALGANQATGSSQYLRSKGEGENLVHTFGQKEMHVTSFQPSVVFGENDQFVNQFASVLRLCPGLFPLACPNAKLTPVYVDDLVKLMVDSLDNPGSYTKHYPVCGPEQFTLKEILELIAEQVNPSCKILPLSDFFSRLQAQVLQLLPGKLFTMDNYRSLKTDSVCTGNSASEMSFRHYIKGINILFGRKSTYDQYRSRIPNLKKHD